MLDPVDIADRAAHQDAEAELAFRAQMLGGYTAAALARARTIPPANELIWGEPAGTHALDAKEAEKRHADFVQAQAKMNAIGR